MAVAYRGNSAQLNSYRTHSVLDLSPSQLILKCYDMALVALATGDGQRASKVLAQLIESLDFRYQEVAAGLFRLYRYCMEEIKRGEYQVPAGIVRELRDSWARALVTTSAAER